MNLHESQSKELFAQNTISTPSGQLADSPKGAVSAAQGLGGSLWVVKAQVHAGGRGKAGGVKVVKDLEGVRAAAPVMAYIAGVAAPPGKPLGNTEVIVAGGKGAAAAKFEVLGAAGISTVHSRAELGSRHGQASPMRGRT